MEWKRKYVHKQSHILAKNCMHANTYASISASSCA
jgi:hypothetical protein